MMTVVNVLILALFIAVGWGLLVFLTTVAETLEERLAGGDINREWSLTSLVIWGVLSIGFAAVLSLGATAVLDVLSLRNAA